MISIISCISKNNAIGYKNDLLFWSKEDMKRFRSLTEGHVVVMGYKTFESMHFNTLKNRINIVLTNKQGIESKNGEIYINSVEKVIDLYNKNDEEIFIIGGESVYKQFLDLNIVDNIYLTEVDKVYTDADRFFPSIDYDDWEKVKEENFIINGLNVKFIDYKKK